MTIGCCCDYSYITDEEVSSEALLFVQSHTVSQAISQRVILDFSCFLHSYSLLKSNLSASFTLKSDFKSCYLSSSPS